MNFILKHWKLLLMAVIGLVVLLYINSITGTTNKLYKMMLDTLRTDQSRVVSTLEQQLSNSEKEVAILQATREKLQKEKVALQVKADQSSAKVTQLKGEIDALNKKYKDYIPPSDPNALIDSIRNRGISTIRLR